MSDDNSESKIAELEKKVEMMKEQTDKKRSDYNQKRSADKYSS